MSSMMTLVRFSKLVQLWRDVVITPTELFVSFLQGLADNSDQIAAFFSQLPQDLLPSLEDFMRSPEDQWVKEMTERGFLALGDY